ncbi:MAG: PLP-dependent cysteine synthase family protein, partial [Candidatus Xenobia bacterium]
MKAHSHDTARTAASIVDLIGNTPLLRVPPFPEIPSGVEVWAKAEWCNPGGSVKDRPARHMVLEAERDGRLTKDKVILDATSGNTGIALAMIGAALGYKVELAMPSNVSEERKHLLRGYGATVHWSSPFEGSDGAIRLARKLMGEHPGRYFMPDQYNNPDNPQAHYLTTGVEIWEQTDGRVTHFVAGLGTSGTVMGTGRRLKAFNLRVQIVALEPQQSLHGLEGLKHMATSIVPGI